MTKRIDKPSPEWYDREDWHKTPEWRRQRRRCFKRDGFRCARCGERYPRGKGLEAHHITPRAEGGGHYLANLISLCPFPCHDLVEVLGLRTRAAIIGSVNIDWTGIPDDLGEETPAAIQETGEGDDLDAAPEVGGEEEDTEAPEQREDLVCVGVVPGMPGVLLYRQRKNLPKGYEGVDPEKELTRLTKPEPKPTKPRATRPRTTKPKAAKPRATRPRTTKPKAAKPRATRPRITKPKDEPMDTKAEPKDTEPAKEKQPEMPGLYWCGHTLAQLVTHRWGKRKSRDRLAREVAESYGISAQTDRRISEEALRRLRAECKRFPELQFYIIRPEAVYILGLEKGRKPPDWTSEVVLTIEND